MNVGSLAMAKAARYAVFFWGLREPGALDLFLPRAVPRLPLPADRES